MVQWLGLCVSSAVLGKRNVGKLGRPAIEVASVELLTAAVTERRDLRDIGVAASKGLDEPW